MRLGDQVFAPNKPPNHRTPLHRCSPHRDSVERPLGAGSVPIRESFSASFRQRFTVSSRASSLRALMLSSTSFPTIPSQ